MFKKLIELEKKIFSAPYKWLVKKGIVTILKTSKKIYRTAEDFYESRYDGPFDERYFLTYSKLKYFCKRG
jgi:hypothetical protein